MPYNRVPVVIKGVIYMELSKKYSLLLALRENALDRIHIMKALFLIWHRSGRNIKDYFIFVPYLYGPCSFDVYSALEDLQSEDLIIRPLHSVPQWVSYHLTERGRRKADEIEKSLSQNTLKLIKDVVNEISELDFYGLLKKVYTEAPDFAINSIFKGVMR